MAWAPKYGLKGMIDASVQVKVEINNEVTDVIVPLEFKTGKGTSGQASFILILIFCFAKEIYLNSSLLHF